MIFVGWWNRYSEGSNTKKRTFTHEWSWYPKKSRKRDASALSFGVGQRPGLWWFKCQALELPLSREDFQGQFCVVLGEYLLYGPLFELVGQRENVGQHFAELFHLFVEPADLLRLC